MRKVRLSLLAVLSSFMFSCATPIVMNVSSLSDTAGNNLKRYYLTSGNENIDPNSLEFKSYAQWVKKGLKNDGYIEVNNIHESDISIILNYGIGDPIATKIYTEIDSPNNKSEAPQKNKFYKPIKSDNNTSTSTSQVIYSYMRFYTLSAIDTREYIKNKKMKELWAMTVKSQGSSGDLEEIFPYLVVGSYMYYGTTKKIEVKVNFRQKSLDELR